MASGVWLVAIGWTLIGFSSSRQKLALLAKKQTDTQQLRIMAQDSERDRLLLEVFTVTTNSPSGDYTLPGTLVSEEVLTVGSNKLRKVTIKTAELPLPDLNQLICRLETNRPPWRLIKCSLETTGQSIAQGLLVFIAAK